MITETMKGEMCGGRGDWAHNSLKQSYEEEVISYYLLQLPVVCTYIQLYKYFRWKLKQSFPLLIGKVKIAVKADS